MNEQENEISESRRIFEILFNLIEEKLPTVLDEGFYVDNASIVRQAMRTVLEKEIITIIPELAERTMIAIWGQSNNIGQIFTLISSEKLGIELNKDLPLLIIPKKEETKKQLYALTYIDKLIPISFDEYKCITRTMYKDNIDIRKLIKGFVLYFNGEYFNQSFLILPEYVNTHSPFLEVLLQMVNKQILVADADKKWQKTIHKLLDQEISFFGTDEDYYYLKQEIMASSLLSKDEEILRFFGQNNVPCINFSVAIELQKVFMDVTVFYSKRKNVLKGKAIKLAEDSIKLESGNVKERVQGYRTNMIDQQEKLDRSYKLFIRACDEIISAATKLELQISNLLTHDLADDVNSEKYTGNLMGVLFKHIYAEDFVAAKEDILRLSKANYQYLGACKCLLKCKQGLEVTASDIVKLKKYPDTVSEIAKIKIEMAKDLGLLIGDLKELISYVKPIESGKEFYYLGKRYLDDKKYKDAADAFMNSLDNDYEKAGPELIKLAEKHPECRIDIEELAENLVAEANFYVGKENLTKKYKKGIVNLKMAATQYHFESIELIANFLFEKYRFLSWKDMEKEDNVHAVYNLIGLYDFLEKKRSCEQYRLKMGLMFCKLNEYARAYSLLKNINLPDAQYECAKMHQYGNGVAKNLKVAQKYYEQILLISPDYKDAAAQYVKICKIFSEEEERKEQTSYSENCSYSPVSSNLSYDEEIGCFVEGTQIYMADKSCKKVEDIAVGDEILIYDHYTGRVSKECVVANVHETMTRVYCPVITLIFSNKRRINIAISHILFDASENRYVWIDSENIRDYVGHNFAVIENDSVSTTTLVDFSVKKDLVKYYVPISRHHLNVIAEGFLTMPPTAISLKLFEIKKNMMYDTSILDIIGITPFEKIKDFVTKEEYVSLPCCYLDAVLANNSDCGMESFIYAIRLFRG